MSVFFMPPAVNPGGKVWNANIYVRASREDEDKSKEQSETITNQIILLTDFVNSRPDMRLHKVYKDDGISGVTFDRPGFNDLMDDVRSGTADCVVVKDLSRLGRDYIETGKLIEEIFPFMGVRFVAVNDNYDSMGDRSASDDIVLPFKNLVNDSYARDISIKVRSSKATKRKNGDFVGPFAAYGYRKSAENKNQLVIDEDAAEIVRLIFSWKLDGMSAQGISDRLNDEGVLSPMEYKLSIGLNFKTQFKAHKTAKWSAVAVFRILKNELYIGTLVQGKVTTPNYKVKARMERPPEQWNRVEHAHDPIISPVVFARVQYLLSLDTRAAPSQKNVYLFSGLLTCSDCGQTMVRHPVKQSGKEYVYYICATAKYENKCGNHNITEDSLTEAVLTAVQARVRLVVDMEGMLHYLDGLPLQQAETAKLQAQLAKKQEEIDRYKRLKLSLLERLEDGILSKAEFVEFKSVYTGRCEDAERAAAGLQAQIDGIVAGTSGKFKWIEQFKEYENLTELTRKVVVSLIQKIEVYQGQRIRIQFYHESEFALLQQWLAQAAAPQPAENADQRKVG